MTSTPQTSTVLIRIITSNGEDLPDGLAVCLDRECQALGIIASTGDAFLRLPSGAGAIFTDVTPGIHRIEVRDANGRVLDAQQITLSPGATLEIAIALPESATPTPLVSPTSAPTLPTATPARTATPDGISGLPTTGAGTRNGPNWAPILLVAVMLLGAAIVTGRRRMP